MRTRMITFLIYLSFATVLSCKESDDSEDTPALNLPASAKQYFDGVNNGDIEAALNAFSNDASVIDVGRTISGKNNIRNWLQNEVMGGRYEVIEVTDRGNETRVLVRFSPGGSGGFRANYDFTFSSNLVTRMNLSYA